MYRRERPGRSRDRLQAAILRKRGRTLEGIARIMGRDISTAHRWLSRMGREGPDGRHDGKSPGRPRLLNPEQERTIEGGLDGTPRDSGFERGSWNGRMVARRILERFGVPYSMRSAIRPAHRLGFPGRKPPIRPMERRHAGGTERVHQEGTGDRRRVEGGGPDRRGRRRGHAARLARVAQGDQAPGRKEAVPTNYSQQSIHMIGALGDGALDLQFHDDLSAGSYVDLVERLRRRYGKVGIIADNASALTGKCESAWTVRTGPWRCCTCRPALRNPAP